MLGKNSVKEVHILSNLVLSVALFKLSMDFLALMVQPTKRKQLKAIFWGNVHKREGWHSGWSSAKCDTQRTSGLGSALCRRMWNAHVWRSTNFNTNYRTVKRKKEKKNIMCHILDFTFLKTFISMKTHKINLQLLSLFLNVLGICIDIPDCFSWPSLCMFVFAALFVYMYSCVYMSMYGHLLTADCISLIRTIHTLWFSITAPPSGYTLSVLTGKVCGRTCLLCCRDKGNGQH